MQQNVAASIQQRAAKAVTAAKLKAVDSILWGQKPSRSASEYPDSSVLASPDGMICFSSCKPTDQPSHALHASCLH